MSEFDSSGIDREASDASTNGPDAVRQEPAADGATDTELEPRPRPRSHELMVVVEPPEARSAAGPRTASEDRFYLSQFHLAAAAALGVVVAVAGALFLEDRQQANALVEQASETESLAHTIKSLKVRLDAIDTVASSADLTDLRRSVAEIKSSVVSARQFSGALTQLSERVDKLNREENAKVDKLAERVDHEGSALTAGLSARIDKLEQKIAAPALAPSSRSPSPSNPQRVPSSTPFRWTGRAQSNALGRFCAATSSSTLAMTSRWSAGAMASVKSVRGIFFPERAGSSASSSGATAGWS